MNVMSNELIDFVVQAVKRTTPQKPIVDESYNVGNYRSLVAHCCNCGKLLEHEDCYCSRCGTKVDWDIFK